MNPFQLHKPRAFRHESIYDSPRKERLREIRARAAAGQHQTSEQETARTDNVFHWQEEMRDRQSRRKTFSHIALVLAFLLILLFAVFGYWIVAQS